MTTIGSCGETRERTAATIHRIVALLWTVECAAAIGIVALSAVAAPWHWRSVATHTRRAIERGEI